jgi:hypothetical protein
MGDFEWGRENGLWGDDGIPYEITDELSDDYDEDYSNNFDIKKSDKNRIYYTKDSFPGMRESGRVKNTPFYTIAEYENKNFRLEIIAKQLQKILKEHFVLYDYKGTIFSDKQKAINILKGIHGDSVKVDFDDLYISDNLLTIQYQDTPPNEDNLQNDNTKFKNRKNPVRIPNNINLKNAKPSFNIEAISKSLASIITKKPDGSGMMVGIFGKWGRGKTYLFNNIWHFINQGEVKYHRVDFSAWKYQETKESWAYLYETLMDQYLNKPSENKWIPQHVIKLKRLFCLNYQKNGYFPILLFFSLISFLIYLSFYNGNIQIINLILGSFGLLTTIKLFMFYLTNNTRAFSLIKKYTNKPAYTEYLGIQAEIEEEIALLVKSWIPKADGRKIILFVDDIDRCDTTKVIKIIDGLRIILDNKDIYERLIIITAVDECILNASIMMKYQSKDINFRNNLFQEYIEKIFIIGIKLNDLDKYEAKEYMSNIIKNDTNINSIEISEDTTNKNEHLINNDSIRNYDKKTREKSDNKIGSIVNNQNNVIYQESLDLTKEIEISNEEEIALIESIVKLEDSTPRKIKIFYYKYLILKQIFHVRLLEKNLTDTWDIESDENLLVDILIYISNNKNTNGYTSNINMNILKELKYSANMLSVL